MLTGTGSTWVNFSKTFRTVVVVLVVGEMLLVYQLVTWRCVAVSMRGFNSQGRGNLQGNLWVEPEKHEVIFEWDNRWTISFLGALGLVKWILLSWKWSFSLGRFRTQGGLGWIVCFFFHRFASFIDDWIGFSSTPNEFPCIHAGSIPCHEGVVDLPRLQGWHVRLPRGSLRNGGFIVVQWDLMGFYGAFLGSNGIS